MASQHELWSELSQEWNSEPRSSPSSVALPTYSGPTRQPVKDLQRGSRIPRSTGQLRSGQPSSVASHHGSSVAQRALQPGFNALSERSASDINSRPHSSPPSAHEPKNSQRTMASRPSTMSSAHSMIKHTDSLAKGSAMGPQSVAKIPGWKQLAMRNQDLFSPIGLESVFQQQTPGADNNIKSSITFACDLGSMPSSPPPRHVPQPGVGATIIPLSDGKASLNFSQIKEGQQEAGPTDGPETVSQGATSRDMNKSSQQFSSSLARSESDQRSKADANVYTQPPIIGSRPDEPQKSSNGTGETPGVESRGGNSGLSPTARGVDKSSATVSSPHTMPSGIGGSSSSATGGFSPVFISKHNTVDGRVDYAAFDPSDLPSIGENVSQDRGGRSNDGSFRRRPLSPSASSSAIPSDSVVPSDSVSQVHQRDRRLGPSSCPLAVRLASEDDPEASAKPSKALSSDLAADDAAHISHASANGGSGRGSQCDEANGQLTHGVLVSVVSERCQMNTGLERANSLDLDGSIHQSRSKTTSQELGSDMQSADTVVHMADDVEAPRAHSQETDVNAVTPKCNDNQSRDLDDAPPSIFVAARAKGTDLPAEHVTHVVETQHQRLRTIIGKKRKDARYEHDYRSGDNASLTRRDVLRPRNPTPGQGRKVVSRSTSEMPFMAQRMSATHSMPLHAESVLIPAQSREAGQIRALTSEVATFRMHSRVAQLTGVRKQSVSTQDYIDEAMKIMDLIRARKNVSSNPASSDITTGDEDELEEIQEESQLKGCSPILSRPPSRDGPISGWRSNAFEQVDSKVLNHLRKYEETGDDSFLVSSILRTVKISKQPGEPEQEGGFHIIDNPKNSSISRRHSDPALPQIMNADEDEPADTRQSDRATDSSGRTIQTASTQTRRNLARIAPEHISHLLQDEEGGMRYDTHKQTWVRTKRRADPRSVGRPSSSSGAEDDILGQIPDLSVNDQDEQARSRTPSQNEPSSAPKKVAISSLYHLHPDMALVSSKAGTVRREDLESMSSAPCSISEAVNSTLSLADPRADVLESDVSSINDHEVSFEAQEVPEDDYRYVAGGEQPQDQGRAKRREQSVFFSSPPVSRAWEAKHWTDSTSEDRQDGVANQDPNLDSSQLVPYKAARQGRPPQRTHIDPRHYRNPALACVDERREFSFTERRPDGRTMSLSLSISTPLARIRSGTAPVRISSGLRHQSFARTLSSLSDFTLNQDDRRHKHANALSKPLLQLERYDGHVTARSSLIIGNLVEKLTSAEPNEPFWDFMSSLTLAHQGLEALYGLDDFCPRLGRLDASDNGLKHLEGAPSSLRTLRLCNNSLCSLTSWGHLLNLQYLDVSGNDLTNLEACSSLIHLRELKADDNRIASVDGVLDLDGLVSLSLRRNELYEVDFATADMVRLEHLDMSNNKLTQVKGLPALIRLRSLTMSYNSLSDFPAAELHEGSHSAVRSLRMLDVSHNALTSLHIQRLPRLQSLCADHNHLSRLEGFEAHKNLRTLHLRNQKYDQPGGILSLDSFATLQHFYLSGTPLPPLLPMTMPFLQLQTLDVSFTGLQALPSDFGLLTPALQILNLNANSLKDLRPLDGIPGLQHLLVVGNRVGRLRMLMRTLKCLNALKYGALEGVDFRDNPLCVGFYPSVGQLTTRSTTLVRKALADSADLAEQEHHDVESDDEDEDVLCAMSHILAPLPVAVDKQHVARLDDDTKMKRRLYELLLATKCPKLKSVDGMDFDRARVEQRDEVWDDLIGKGVVEQAAASSEA